MPKKQQRVLNIKFFSGNMGKGIVIDESKEKSKWFGLDSIGEQKFCKK